MAFDAVLAERVRSAVQGVPDLTEKHMFGGVAYLVRGNMACGIHGDDLIVRVGVEAYSNAAARPHTRPFDLTGRPMKGWVTVAPDGTRTNDALAAWLQDGISFGLSLPSK